MLSEAIIIAGDRAGPDVRLRTNVRVAEIGQVRHFRAFADDGLLHFHKISGARAIFEVRSRTQTGEGANDGVVVQTALHRDAVRLDHDVVPQNHVA